jgi:hypothetical protein
MALTWALIDTLLYAGGTHVITRHVLEAALVAAAASSTIMDRDFSQPLLRLADSARLVPMIRPNFDADQLRLSIAYAKEKACGLRIHSLDSREYVQSVHIQARTSARASVDAMLNNL